MSFHTDIADPVTNHPGEAPHLTRNAAYCLTCNPGRDGARTDSRPVAPVTRTDSVGAARERARIRDAAQYIQAGTPTVTRNDATTSTPAPTPAPVGADAARARMLQRNAGLYGT